MKKYDILIVDDDIFCHMITKEFLNHPLINLISAYNGLEAIDLVYKLSIDLIIMDEMMPKMTGTEASKIIRDLHPEMLIVSLSAYEREMLKDNKYCDEFLQKPVSKRILLEKISKLLNDEQILQISDN